MNILSSSKVRNAISNDRVNEKECQTLNHNFKRLEIPSGKKVKTIGAAFYFEVNVENILFRYFFFQEEKKKCTHFHGN